MRTWSFVFGAMILIALVVALKTESVQHGIASLYVDVFGDDNPPDPVPICQPGKLVLSASDCVPGSTPAGRFVVNTLVEINSQGVSLPPSRRALSNSRVIQRIADDLNASLRLPRDIPVQLTACGEVNAFYNPETQSIQICDEWVDKLQDLFADLAAQPEAFTQAVLSATAFVFAHEVGHALIHQYQLDFTGPEEDVADQYAVYLLAGTPTGAQEVLAGAIAFGRFAEDGGEGVLWDNHSLDAQRYFNILCWAYGSDPGVFLVVLTDLGLPLPRAQSCQDEYRKMAAGFDRLLQSHRRNSRTLLAQ